MIEAVIVMQVYSQKENIESYLKNKKNDTALTDILSNSTIVNKLILII